MVEPVSIGVVGLLFKGIGAIVNAVIESEKKEKEAGDEKI